MTLRAIDILNIKIRPDCIVQFGYLPLDLTKEEAAKIVKVIYAHATEKEQIAGRG